MGELESAEVVRMQDRMAAAAAASYLGLSKSTLDKMRSQGRGPRYFRLGGRVFYRKADLDDYIKAGVVETADSRAKAG
ncbi:helix-turn-helix transcriptional regulator [Pseudoxanthomonas winnipegensis]|uniref:DNA-binding protein n=1 Tax=Pseudoxanthomonas winnipegensis TaxID=2480810 RepID=A0A4Q8LQY9_9GAMM|nr:helix-turn-helix domain-containing protein [Pseudoxanthomonas winnipegensis]RZZ84788.1 DNA-binding protein [Pseudoxanthomonas winnipegensis]TAA33729.1 DNA-binding protein [Pseudoxanthomonas winnipegensis]